jgi:hypothetical protein
VVRVSLVDHFIGQAADPDPPAPCRMDLSSFMDVEVIALGRTSNPEGGLCARSLWTFKEGSNSDGRPDLRVRSLRKSENLKGRISTLPHPPNPKQKPAGLKRRARGLYRRRERGTEAPRSLP